MRILYFSKHVARVALGVAHGCWNIALANKCNDLDLRSKGKSHIAVHHVLGRAGNAGNECADSTTSLGFRGFLSEDNVPWPDGRFLAQRLLNIVHCFSRVCEVFVVSLLSWSWNSPWLCPVVLVDVFSVGHFVLSSQRRLFSYQKQTMKELMIENFWVTSPKNVGSFHHGQVHRPIAIQEANENSRCQGLEYTKNGPSSAHDAASYRLFNFIT